VPLSLAFDLLTRFLAHKKEERMSDRRLIPTSLAFLLGASLTALAAQTPSPTAQTTGSNSAPSNAITVQGCIQPSVNAVSATPDAVAAGTSGSVSTATAYILTRSIKPAATSGSNASGAAALASTYQLSAEDSKLTPHVGHKVEITGTLVSPNASASSRAASAAGLAPAPTLKVENVKMMADTCTP
jgi:hypothetical protein